MTEIDKYVSTQCRRCWRSANKRGKLLKNDLRTRIEGLHNDLMKEVEEYNEATGMSEHINGISANQEELADIVIMCMTISHEFGYNLADLVRRKMQFNETRDD